MVPPFRSSKDEYVNDVNEANLLVPMLKSKCPVISSLTLRFYKRPFVEKTYGSKKRFGIFGLETIRLITSGNIKKKNRR